jgi:large subunit ribosomal protein L15
MTRIAGKELTLDALVEAGLARKGEAIKLVGKAEVKGKYTVTVNRVSASVRSAIEAAGGLVTELSPRDKPEVSGK